MTDTPILWLRVATALYAVGLTHCVLVIFNRSSERFFRVALNAFCVGVILHTVSFTELAIQRGRLPLDNFFQSISAFALFTAIVFLLAYWRLQFEGLGLLLFPLVFVATLVADLGQPVGTWAHPAVRDAWLLAHVLLILVGYAALGLAAVASVFYLLQEKRLKRRRELGWLGKFPPLGTLDRVLTHSIGLAFLCITLGVIVGSTWAFVESGTRWIRDPKITVSLLTWGFYLVMVFLRSAAGWRGRKAAVMVLVVVCCSAVTWAAHVGLKPLLVR